MDSEHALGSDVQPSMTTQVMPTVYFSVSKYKGSKGGEIN